MDFFIRTKAVRLKSHLDKYLIADDDQISTRQSRNGTAARKSRWTVELIDGNDNAIRLKSCHNRYLTASESPFLMGLTGNKVLQTLPENPENDLRIEWWPVRDGFLVKLKSFAGTYLKANGGTPPWRNSVTHDQPLDVGTHDGFVWDVEEVEVPEDEEAADYWAMVTTMSSVSDDISGLELELGSPVAVAVAASSPRWASRWLSMTKSHLYSLSRTTAMDLFKNAKAVRLKSVHQKYLIADDDEESVAQDRTGSAKAARWTVEFVENTDNIIRLKSCYGKYLTASNRPFLLGMTGRKVLQTMPARLDSSIEWEPIRENGAVKLKTRYGQFLRANGGLPPWRNSVTHDIPHRTATQDWILWEVHVVDIVVAQSAVGKEEEESVSSTGTSPLSRQESNDSFVVSPPKLSEGRLIYYHIANEQGQVEEGSKELCISFQGNDVRELTVNLERELGVEGLTVCTRSPFNGKLYPLRLHLPPNNATMHVVVLLPSSNK